MEIAALRLIFDILLTWELESHFSRSIASEWSAKGVCCRVLTRQRRTCIVAVLGQCIDLSEVGKGFMFYLRKGDHTF